MNHGEAVWVPPSFLVWKLALSCLIHACPQSTWPQETFLGDHQAQDIFQRRLDKLFCAVHISIRTAWAMSPRCDVSKLNGTHTTEHTPHSTLTDHCAAS